MKLPLLCHVVSINNENCHLTMPVVKGCFAHDMLLHTFYIDMFELNKFIKNNSTTVKHIYNESVNLTVVMLLELVEFPINSASGRHRKYGDMHLPSLHMRLLDSDYLTPSICSLIKLLWKSWCHFLPKSPQSHYDLNPKHHNLEPSNIVQMELSKSLNWHQNITIQDIFTSL